MTDPRDLLPDDVVQPGALPDEDLLPDVEPDVLADDVDGDEDLSDDVAFDDGRDISDDDEPTRPESGLVPDAPDRDQRAHDAASGGEA
jgi:hypothetical protein